MYWREKKKTGGFFSDPGVHCMLDCLSRFSSSTVQPSPRLLTVKLIRSFRIKKLSDFLEEEICLYFFIFCLKNFNFLMCITRGRKISEDASLTESRVLLQSSCCSISPHLPCNHSSLLLQYFKNSSYLLTRTGCYKEIHDSLLLDFFML